MQKLLKSLLVTAALCLPLNPAYAESKRLFIQVWTTPGPDLDIDEGETPGRIEIELGGKFAACAEGKSLKEWNSEKLSPISIGFIGHGDPSTLKLTPYGAMGRQKFETKITEAPE